MDGGSPDVSFRRGRGSRGRDGGERSDGGSAGERAAVRGRAPRVWRLGRGVKFITLDPALAAVRSPVGSGRPVPRTVTDGPSLAPSGPQRVSQGVWVFKGGKK